MVEPHALRHAAAGVLAALLVGAAVAGAGQDGHEGRPGRRGAEVARLFDEYAIARAQESLGLDQAQHERFVPRFRALQAARRRQIMAHRSIVRDLASLTRPEAGAGDEALNERLRALAAADAGSREAVDKALADVDEVLTVRQRARFRVFEEDLERRKFELMT